MRPSQKTLFIQSVYLTSLIHNMLVNHSLLETQNEQVRKQEEEAMQAKLMSKLTQLDDGQLLVKMLASLQETLVFVQGLSNRAEDD